MSEGTDSLAGKVRSLFEKNIRYTVEDICNITRASPLAVRVTISNLKNPAYATKKGPMVLSQILSPLDLRKRWGLPSADAIYEPKNPR